MLRSRWPSGYTARMNTTPRIALLALFAALALAACGNKGPLVLPDEDAAEDVSGEAAEEADATDATDATDAADDGTQTGTPVDATGPADDGRG